MFERLKIALEVGNEILNKFKEEIGDKEYNKIINNTIKGCKCGFIKEGNEILCPKCELPQVIQNTKIKKNNWVEK